MSTPKQAVPSLERYEMSRFECHWTPFTETREYLARLHVGGQSHRDRRKKVMTANSADQYLPWATFAASCTVSVLTLIYAHKLIRMSGLTAQPIRPTSTCPPNCPNRGELSEHPLTASATALSPTSTVSPNSNGSTPTVLAAKKVPGSKSKRTPLEILCSDPRTNKAALNLLLQGHRAEAVAIRTGAALRTVQRYAKVIRDAGVDISVVQQQMRKVVRR